MTNTERTGKQAPRPTGLGRILEKPPTAAEFAAARENAAAVSELVSATAGRLDRRQAAEVAFMKTLPIFGVSLLVASMGLVATAPVYAATAASLSAVFIATGSDATSSVGPADTADVSTGIKSLSVSAASGANAAVAGGYADATNAVSIGGAVDALSDTTLTVAPTGLNFTSTLAP